MTESRPRTAIVAAQVLGWATVLGALSLVARENFLLFHSLAEGFSIVVAAGVFMVAWNARRYLQNHYLLFLGIAYAFIALLDFLHTLAYGGMNVFPGTGSDVATQLWVGARGVEAVTLVLAPLFVVRRLRVPAAFATYAAVTAFVLLSIITWDVFPTCYLEPSGLTPFKIACEYGIVVLLAGALAGLYARRRSFDRVVLRTIAAAIVLTMAAEISFTTYLDVYGLTNQLGHYFKIGSFCLIYRAVIATGLRQPYDLLFRELRQSNLRAARAKDLSDALAGIILAAISADDPDEALETVAARAAASVGCDAAAITLLEDGDWVTRHAHGLGGVPPDWPLGGELGAMFARSPRRSAPVVIADEGRARRGWDVLVAEHDVLSALAVPLRVRQLLVGVLSLHHTRPPTDGRAVFGDEEREFAVALASAVSVATERARLFAAEHAIADTLQESLVTTVPRIPGLRVGHAYHSSAEVARIGGDFYDVFELDGGLFAFVIGDVSGKGLPAATTTAVVRTTIRAYAYLHAAPSRVLTEANAVLHRQLDSESFVTVLFGVVDVREGTLRMASAGHPDPMVCRIAACEFVAARRDMPLGMVRETTYEDFETRLGPGDLLVVYTDGLIEARSGGSFFGEERAMEVIHTYRDAGPDGVAEALMEEVTGFSGGQLSDDVAILVFGRAEA